jgi:predicted dienelactone hydrolase
MQERLLGAALVAFVTAASVNGQQVNRLPEPAGPYGIGRMAFEWLDAQRFDPFPPDRKEFRRVMVYLWYPTTSDQKTGHGAYLPGAKQIDAATGFDRSRFGSIWPLILSGAIASHARDNAPPAADHSTWPIVVFSHGNSTTSFSYTTAIEDLVSHGYVVAGVEHPYISAAVAFPSGTVIVYMERSNRPSRTTYLKAWSSPCATCGSPPESRRPT